MIGVVFPRGYTSEAFLIFSDREVKTYMQIEVRTRFPCTNGVDIIYTYLYLSDSSEFFETSITTPASHILGFGFSISWGKIWINIMLFLSIYILFLIAIISPHCIFPLWNCVVRSGTSPYVQIVIQIPMLKANTLYSTHTYNTSEIWHFTQWCKYLLWA